MSTNTLITAQVIANRALRRLKRQSVFLGRVNTQYAKEFRGKATGDTIYIRKPVQYTLRQGPVVNLQDVNQQTIALTVQPEIGVDFQFSDFDLALKIEEFDENFIKPAVDTIATGVDLAIAGLFKQIGNSVGTPGSLPTTQQAAQLLVLNAGAKLTNNATPVGYRDRNMSVGPYSEATFISALNLGFNDQRLIGDQYKEGSMGIALGFDWAMSPSVPTFLTGTHAGTPLVNGANQGVTNTGTTDNPTGVVTAGSLPTTSLITDGWTASSAVLKAGDIFTLAGVFEVHPLTKQSTGQLRQFVSTTDITADGSGNATIIAAPAIIAGGSYKNVTARPADNAALTLVGAASTTYEENLAWHKDAFTFACVPLEIPKGMDMAAEAQEDGLAIRIVRGFDIINNRRISRLDVVAGYAALRPEWAVRVQGNAVS